MTSNHSPPGKQWLFMPYSLIPSSRYPHTWAECFHRNRLLLPQVGQTEVLQFKKRKQVRNWNLCYFPCFSFISKQQNLNLKHPILQQFSSTPPRAPSALQRPECSWPVSCRAGRCDILPRSSEEEYDIPLWAFWIQKSLLCSKTQSKSF